MEVDVKAARFLEHGEYEGNLYGTKIDSIHEVVATGRTCIMDVNPQVSSQTHKCPQLSASTHTQIRFYEL